MDVSDLEDISRYNHSMRRGFAEHIVYKFGATFPCILDSSDFINPFAQQIARLFNAQLQRTDCTCIFIKADGLTTLCLSGSLKLKFKIAISEVQTSHCVLSEPDIQIVVIADIKDLENHFKTLLNPILE